ncbi:MAG: PIN domain-containing protein [Pseudonocardiaceae bacterium]
MVARCLRSPARAGSQDRRGGRADHARRRRAAYEFLVTDQEVWDRALDVQRELALRSMTRSVGIPDLLIAAVAELHRVTVLHYEADFDHISGITGQPTEWVVPRGTVP